MKKVIRYIGSKEKLIDFLQEKIFEEFKNSKIRFFDGFSGSTFVSKYCQENFNWNISLSDISKYTEILTSRLNINNCSLEVIKIAEETQYEEGTTGIISKEFSLSGKPETYSKDFFKMNGPRGYFTKEVGNKIDNMRDKAISLYKDNKINTDELNLMLMVAIAFADKNANTTSVYGAYLKNQSRETRYIKEDFFNVLIKEKHNNLNKVNFISGSILESLEKIEYMDVIYLDPPYNTRRYESNYHILNYIADIDFNTAHIKFDSKTGLPFKTVENQFGSKKGTKLIFEEMIKLAVKKGKYVFISYSTDGEMSVDNIIDICKKHNIIYEIYYKDYKRFKASKIETNNKELKEIIFKLKDNV